MNTQLTAQQLYDAFYMEALARTSSKGQPDPDEVEVFKVLVKETKKAIANGDCPPDFLDELAEVKAIETRAKVEAKRLEDIDKALREGSIIDLNAL